MPATNGRPPGGIGEAPLSATILDRLEAMPPRQRAAARWVLDHAADVALLSMREQAKRAGVPPATMTRFAQSLGLSGYEDLRALYAEALRERPADYRGRAEQQLARRAAEGDEAFVADVMGTLAGHMAALGSPEAVGRLVAAADRLAGARRVFCFGQRSSFAAVYVFHYVHALFGEASVLVDAAGSIGIDSLRLAGKGDALLAVSCAPYNRSTVEAVAFARENGVEIVAVTDSRASPLARLADALVLAPIATPSFFHTIVPAVAVAEALAALIAARKGEAALAALEATQRQLAAFSIYLDPDDPQSKR